MRSSCPVLAVLAALALPVTVSAHDPWLERSGRGLVLRNGHHGHGLLAIDRAKVKAAHCVARGARRDLLATAAFAAKEVTFKGRCDAASALLDGGFWSLTPDGEVNRPRTEVPQAVKAWASRQLAKWVDARSAAASSVVLGDELELVPVGDLSRARQGDEITVRVLSGGKPVRGAVVDVDDRPLGVSDAAGEVRVRLHARDLETLSATVRRKLGTPEADTLVLEASLTFEVAR